MIALPSPMIDHREFDQRDRELFDHNILKNTHQRYFISHLDPHVVAQKRIDQA